MTIQHEPKSSTTKTMKDHLFRAIMYGSKAEPISVPNSDHTHRWTVYVRGFHDEDISSYIRRVTFRLHESFPSPSRTIEGPPFEVTESGWGEFQIIIRITFQDPNQKPLQLVHFLRLYPLQDIQPNSNFIPEPNSSSTKKNISSAPVISENYEEIVFEVEGKSRMSEILLKESKYMDLSTSHRYQELLTNEHDEIQRLEAAITTIKSQITELNPVSNLIQKEPKPNKLNNELYYKNSSVENIDKTEQITKIDSSSKFEIKPESTVKTSTTSSDAITPLASITKRIKTRSRR